MALSDAEFLGGGNSAPGPGWTPVSDNGRVVAWQSPDGTEVRAAGVAGGEGSGGSGAVAQATPTVLSDADFLGIAAAAPVPAAPISDEAFLGKPAAAPPQTLNDTDFLGAAPAPPAPPVPTLDDQGHHLTPVAPAPVTDSTLGRIGEAMHEASENAMRGSTAAIQPDEMPNYPQTRDMLNSFLSPVQAGMKLGSGFVGALGGGVNQMLQELGAPQHFAQGAEGFINDLPQALGPHMAPEIGAATTDAAGAMLSDAQRQAASEDFQNTGVARFAQAVRDSYDPLQGRADATRTAGTARQMIGEETRDAAQQQVGLQQFRPLVDSMDEPTRRDLLDYVETRSTRVGPSLQEAPEIKPLADALRDAYSFYKDKLQALPQTEKMGFIEDYVNHMWKRDTPEQRAHVTDFLAKQGSTGFTRERTVPTYAEGIKAGLEPVTTDPLAITGTYIENAKRYIAHARLFNEMAERGDVRYSRTRPAEGYTPLQGRYGEAHNGMTAWAPDGAATVYNNFISKGFSGNPIYEGARAFSMSLTAAELALSAYHWSAESLMSAASDAAFGLRQVAQGNLKEGGKALGRPAVPGASQLAALRLGDQVRRAYERPGSNGAPSMTLAERLRESDRPHPMGAMVDVVQHGVDKFLGRNQDLAPEMQPVIDVLTKANAGFSRDPYYRATLGLQKGWREIGQAFQDPSLLRKVGVGGQAVGKIMETIQKPLFEKYIPALKRSVMYREVAAWMKDHPNASMDEAVAFARQVADSVDNRFGVMQQDNLFWNKAFKQVIQLTERAPTWNVGVIREAGGGLKDAVQALGKAAQGEKIDGLPLRTATILGYAITLAYLNTILQYLHGQGAPQDARDLLAYRTGGETPKGAPERGFLPGQHHDIVGWLHDPNQEAYNKASTAFHIGKEDLENRDWRDDPIADPAHNWLERLGAYGADAAGRYEPFSIEMMRQQQGSHLNLLERALGIRGASQFLTDPERAQSVEDYIARKRVQVKGRHENQDRQKYVQ